MKLTKFGILVKKTTSFFTSIRDSKISRGCVKILEIPEGMGGVNFGGPILESSEGRGVHTANPFHWGGGGVWIFSGTTHCKLAREPRRNQEAYEAWAPQSQRNKKIK